MAKTESTAVNELIELVQSKQAAPAEPAADLFAASEPFAKPTRVTPPRIVAPVPPLPAAAADVAPLSPRRAPHSTSRQRVIPPVPAVRMSTADPALARTIPPLSQPTTPPAPRAHAGGPKPTPRSTRAQRPASPAPVAVASSPSSAAPVPPPPPNLRASQQVPVVAHAHEGSDVTPLPMPRADDSPLPFAWNAPLSTEPSPLAQRPTVPSAPSLPPPTAPVAAPFDSSPRRARTTTSNPLVARPVPQQYPVVRAESWFDSGRLKKVDRTEGTAIVTRQYGDGLLKKLIVPMLLAICIGVAVGGYLAMNARDGKKAEQAAAIAPSGDTRVAMPVSPAPEAPAGGAAAEAQAQGENAEGGAQAESESILPAATAAALAGADAAPTPAAPAPAAPAPAAPAPAAETPVAPTPAVATSSESGAAPAVREVQTPRGVVKLVDVRIDSTPPGATVMLVDGGKTSFLGSTPLATSLDPSRKYDVIFTLPGRPTQMASLDPAKTSRLDVTLGRAKSERSTKRKSRATADSSFGDAIEAKAETAEPAEKPEKAEKAVAETKTEPAGEGTLMVNSKPPCEILIDGKPTGLTTPQRSIPLPAGTHKVTFVNASAGINKTVSVTITAGQATKLIQDLMKK